MAGKWIGTLEWYPKFVRMTLDLPTAADARTSVQGTLRLDGGVGPQGGPKGQLPVTARLDPASRTLTLTLGPDARPLGLPVGELYGYLDTRSETVAGIIGNWSADSSPFFVLAREPMAEERIFMPIASSQSAPRASRPLGQDAGTARADLDRWVQRLFDEYPQVDPARTAPVELLAMARKLFSDADFEAHFGTTFDRMEGADRQRVITGIRTVPMTREKTSAMLHVIERPFMQMLGTGTAPEMVLSVIAMRYLEAWRQGAVVELAAGGEALDAFDTASAFDEAGAKLAPYIWPSDRTALAAATIAARNRTARTPLVAEVDKLLASASGIGGIRALDAALKLSPGAKPKSAIDLAPRTPQLAPTFAQPTAQSAAPTTAAVRLVELAKWAPDTWAAQKPRLNAKADELLTKLLADGRATLGLVPAGGAAAANPTERLQKSKAWYQSQRDVLEGFASQPAVAAFLNDLAAQREADFAAAMPQMSARLKSLSSTAEVQSYGRDLSIDFDLGRSASWQRFEQQRGERLAAIDRAAAAARVGPGPFGPDYPGAAYLNALYRNDTARLAQEDQAVVQPLSRAMTQTLQTNGMGALTSFLSGGAVPQGGLAQLMNAAMSTYTVADTLTGFFIVAYERVYPKCMDPDPVMFEETTRWDTVIKDGLGNELARYPHSETNYYNVNERYVDAFRKVGTGANPDQLDLTMALFSPLLSKDVTEPVHTVTDALRGLRIAMTQNACDSPLIKTLERNMIAYVLAK
jgi:hypothetical protein